MAVRRLARHALAVAFTLAALSPFRSYDAFWHLATGRWIAEHRALPVTDPFAVASDRTPWINGEWLAEIAMHAVEVLGGLAALSWLRAILAALIFTTGYLLATRDGADPPVAIALSCAAFAGAMATLDARPSLMAALLLPLSIYTARRGSIPWYTLITAIWINVHPSALLAPFIAVVVRGSLFVVRGSSNEQRTASNGLLPLASALALLLNPFGWRAIAAPLELLSFVGGGTFVNAEWLPSSPVLFPLLYVLLAVGFAAYATADDRRAQLWRIVLFVVLGWLALRHVRHQGLFFAAYPLLVAPAVRPGRVRPVLAYAAGVAAVLLIAMTATHGVGPAPSRFPIRSVARLKETGLRGNVYNADQFGGYLIWAFYPERRTLTDGRNELHRTFIRDYAKARLDERAWRALLGKHRVVLAVDEYRAPIPVVRAGGGETRMMPASLAYWPRRDWALIGYDDVSMVFARRDAFAGEVIEKWEIRGVVPDARHSE